MVVILSSIDPSGKEKLHVTWDLMACCEGRILVREMVLLTVT